MTVLSEFATIEEVVSRGAEMFRRSKPDGVPTGRPPVRFNEQGERGTAYGANNKGVSPVAGNPPVAISPAPGGGPAGPDPVGNHPYMIRHVNDSTTSSLVDVSQAIGQYGNYEPHTWLGIVQTPTVALTNTYGALSGYNNITNGVNGWKFVMYRSGAKLRLRVYAVSTALSGTVDLEYGRRYAVAFTADDGGASNTTVKAYSLDLDTPGATVSIETLSTTASITNSSARYNLFRAEGFFSMPCSMCGAAWWNRALSDAEISEMMDEGGSGHFSTGGPEPLDYDNMSESLKTDLICYHALQDDQKADNNGVVDSHTGGYTLTWQGGLVTQADPFIFRVPGPGQPDSAIIGTPTTEYTFAHEWRIETLANGPWWRDHGQSASRSSVLVSGSEEDGDRCVIDAGGVPLARNVTDPNEVAYLRVMDINRTTMVPTMDTSADYVIAWVTDSYPQESPDTYMVSIRGGSGGSYRLQVQAPGGGVAYIDVEWYRANVLEAGTKGEFQTAFRQWGVRERQWHCYQLRVSGNDLSWWVDGIHMWTIEHNEVTDTFRDQVESICFGGRDNNSDGFMLDGGNGAFAWAGIALASDITPDELHQYMVDRLDERVGLTNTPLQKIRPENNPPIRNVTFTPQTFVNTTNWQYLWYHRSFFNYHEEQISTRSVGGTTYLRKWGNGLTEDLVTPTSFDLRNVADDTTQPRVESDHYSFPDSTVVLQSGFPTDSWRETDAMLFMVAYFDSGGGLKPNFSIISQYGNSSFFTTLDVINSDGTVRMIDGGTHTSSAGAMIYDQWLIIAWLHEEASATDRVWFNGGSAIINTSGGSGARDGSGFQFLGIGAGTTPWKFRDFATMTVLRHIPSSEYLSVINEVGAELDARTPGASVWSTAT